MNGAEVLIPMFGILLVLVPVTGLTLILTARFALKPLVETLARALRESGFASSPDAKLQIQDLSDQVQLLTEQIARLQQTQEFDRKLMQGKSEGTTAGT